MRKRVSSKKDAQKYARESVCKKSIRKKLRAKMYAQKGKLKKVS